MSTILDVRGLRKSYGARTLLDGVDLSVAEGESVGVIGRNGTGKSTLFRILAGLEGYEEGEVALRSGTSVGYLPQAPEMDPDVTVFETAAEGRRELQAALAEYRRVTLELTENPPPDRLERLLDRQARLTARIEDEGGWNWDHRVEEVLTRLGIGEWERPLGRLSGGERRRVALARTLLSDPDLLLLDEPTNHLDAETVLWLEETIFDFPGSVLVITHDRYFLDRVVDRMIEVSVHGLTSYQGGYTEYLEARSEQEVRREVEEGKRAKLLEKELAWARRSPPARTGKQKARRERAHDMVEKQRSRDRTRPREVELELEDGPRLGSKVLEFHDISKSFGDQPIILDLSDRLRAGERVGVIGPNGAGKTTLLRMLVGEEEPDTGEVVWGENTRIGYFDQERELDGELTVERAVSESDWVELGNRRMHLRAYLERFLFPPYVQRQKVSALSGGERNRVLLAGLLIQKFNFLVLDEPTNDLDLDTLRILEDALESFGGCLVVVSHDRYLLDKLATSLWVFEGEGRVHRHHGGWDSYLARRGEAQAREEAGKREEELKRREERRKKAEEDKAQRRATEPRKLSYREKQELETAEGRIAKLEEEKAELEAALADPDLYRDEQERVADITRRYEEVKEELEALFLRWMELEEGS